VKGGFQFFGFDPLADVLYVYVAFNFFLAEEFSSVVVACGLGGLNILKCELLRFERG